ncbi:MAG: LacI family DNA-binding transcriptional regulator [Ferruginibacter sp.]
MNNTTLKRIAEALDLSISTVSRALKDHPDISARTKERVKELANTLDYEPNANAVHLRTNKTNLLGVIVPSVSNFFYDSFISAVEEEARKNNYSLMILQSGDDAITEAENIKLCRQNRVSGVFACITKETVNADAFIKLKEHDIPVIFFDKVPEDASYNKVCVADSAAASIAANVLVENKTKKILALFGNSNLSITKKRLKAFTETIAGRASISTAFAENIEEAETKTAELLAEKPGAVFCMSDETLAGAMKAIQRKHLNIPSDISVIAISNGFIPKLYFPEITYVETSGYKLGKLAFSVMVANISGSTFVQELTIDAILVKGGSL